MSLKCKRVAPCSLLPPAIFKELFVHNFFFNAIQKFLSFWKIPNFTKPLREQYMFDVCNGAGHYWIYLMQSLLLYNLSNLCSIFFHLSMPCCKTGMSFQKRFQFFLFKWPCIGRRHTNTSARMTLLLIFQ